MILGCVVLLFLLSFLTWGQTPPVTAASNIGLNGNIFLHDSGMTAGKLTFLVPSCAKIDLTLFLFPYDQDNTPFVDDSPSLLRPSPQPDRISPLRLQRTHAEELTTPKATLGSDSFGGAAYLAIRGLQKSGAKSSVTTQARGATP